MNRHKSLLPAEVHAAEHYPDGATGYETGGRLRRADIARSISGLAG
jgi:hypothetical protein